MGKHWLLTIVGVGILSIFILPLLEAETETRPYTVDEHTLLLMHFDESKGDVVQDQTQNKNNGKINGAKWTSSGKFGNGLNFNGDNDYVDIRNNDSINFTSTKDMTIECWFKAQSTGNYQNIIAKYRWGQGAGYIIGIDHPNFSERLRVSVRNTSGDEKEIYSQGSVADNTWHHVAITRVGSTGEVTVYLDGMILGNAVVPGDLSSDNDLIIGNSLSEPDYDFKGTIDELRISNIVRPISIKIDKEGKEAMPKAGQVMAGEKQTTLPVIGRECFIDKSDLEGLEEVSNSNINMKILQKGIIILSTRSQSDILAIYEPIICGIWDTPNKEKEVMKLISKDIRNDKETEVALLFQSAGYKVKAKVLFKIGKINEWVRYSFEFINEDDQKKGLQIAIPTELFPLDKVNRAEKWFNLTKPSHVSHPQITSSATYGIPELAYGGKIPIDGWLLYGPPMIGLYDDDKDTGVFIVNSPYHPWTQQIDSDARHFTFMRAIGLAAKQGYSTNEETIFPEGKTYPLETVIGFYKDSWKEIIKKYYQAYPELYRTNTGRIQGGIAGTWPPFSLEQVKANTNAGFGTISVTDEVWDDNKKIILPSHMEPLPMYAEYFDHILLYTGFSCVATNYSFYRGIKPEDYEDSWVRNSEGKRVHYSNVPQWLTSNPDPDLSIFKHFIRGVKETYQKSPIDGIYVDWTGVFVDYSKPTEAYPFKVFYKEIIKAAQKVKEEFPDKLFVNFGGGGCWFRHALDNYIDAGAEEARFEESVSSSGLFPVKVSTGNMNFFVFVYPEWNKGGRTDEESTLFCTNMEIKSCLFWGMVPGSILEKASAKVDKDKIILTFAQNIPVTNKLNSMGIIWDDDASTSKNNLPFNVFVNQDKKLFAISIENTKKTTLIDTITIDRKILGIDDNTQYVLGIWSYEFANSKVIPLEIDGKRWAYGKDINSLNILIAPGGVSVLWIAEYNGGNPVNLGFGFVDPKKGWYTEYTSMRTDDAKISNDGITLPKQKAERTFKFVDWKGTVINTVRTKEKIDAEVYSKK